MTAIELIRTQNFVTEDKLTEGQKLQIKERLAKGYSFDEIIRFIEEELDIRVIHQQEREIFNAFAFSKDEMEDIVKGFEPNYDNIEINDPLPQKLNNIDFE